MSSSEKFIIIKGAQEHNLKSIDLNIPRDKLVILTGVSGSGKSSIAFDTIHAEGKRRYMGSLSPYTRQFLDSHSKPKVESITGLSPSIAIDQKVTSRNPRSTVATATDIYDYVRILFARVGLPFSPVTGLPMEKLTPKKISEKIFSFPKDSEVSIFIPVVSKTKEEFRREILRLRKHRCSHLRIEEVLYPFDDLPPLGKYETFESDALLVKFSVLEDNKDAIFTNICHALRVSSVISAEITKLPADYTGKLSRGDKFLFSEKFSCHLSGISIDSIEPRLFSFNTPHGACPSCNGLGTEIFFDPLLIIPNKEVSIVDGAIAPWYNDADVAKRDAKVYQQLLEALANRYQFSLRAPFSALSTNIQNMLLHGTGEEVIELIDDSGGYNQRVTQTTFSGIISDLERRLDRATSHHVIEELESYQSIRKCTGCSGHRLRQEALCIKVAGYSIGDICSLSIEESIKWCENVKNELTTSQNAIGEVVLYEILNRLRVLKEVGLEYLTLNRSSHTLSGGESQRIRLASQIGSKLSGVVYVLDEPSIGLHPKNTTELIQTLKHLRDLGNTVIVVEHDDETIRSADYIIDIGLGAGKYGGSVIATGTLEELLKHEHSITGQYLSSRLSIPIPASPRQIDGPFLEIVGASSNNLKNIQAKIPLGSFTAITGVSGSGKSTFTVHTLYKALARTLHGTKIVPGTYKELHGVEHVERIISVDQSSIGKTPRSNPATYISAFTLIRDWFTSLKMSKDRGYSPSRFSFNVKGGRCEMCEGDGALKVEMHFLPEVYIECDECRGKRYNKETLEVTYKDRSIAEVLSMTADEAVEFFSEVPHIYEKLVSLCEVGLGYIQLGQSATTLSGGEAQRVKLAKELSRSKYNKGTIIILDEPTTGLHTHDIKRLLAVLHAMVDSGNTVIVIEHNLDVIKTADYVIDFGPHGGSDGGEILVCGTIHDIMNCEKSYTGQYLKNFLKTHAQ